MSGKKILKSASLVGIWTMASRFLGFFRDMMFSRIMGTGGMADSFLAAFLIPNMFRRFLGEGAFNSAFVPLFKKHGDNKEQAKKFAQDSFTGLLWVSLLILALMEIFMPLVISGLFKGFEGSDKFELTTKYSRITMPYMVFMSLSALCAGVLNSLSRFALAAAAPLILNVVLIFTMGLIWVYNPSDAGLWLSVAVFFAGIFQFSAVLWGSFRMKIPLIPKKPVWNDDMRNLLIIALPATLAAGVAQINLVVGRRIISGTDGGISWLNYADRLYQLPLGVIGVAVGVVLLPALSEMIQKKDTKGERDAFNQLLLFSMLLTIPAAVAMLVIPNTLTTVLFEGGEFVESDTHYTAMAIKIYAISLPALIMQRLYLPLYYARSDTKRPLYFAIVSAVVNVVLVYELYEEFGYLSPVVSSVLAAFTMAGLLAWGVRKTKSAHGLSKETRKGLFFVGLGSVVMGVVLFGFDRLLSPWVREPFLGWVIILFLMVVAALVYFPIVLRGLGWRKSDVLRAFRRTSSHKS